MWVSVTAAGLGQYIVSVSDGESNPPKPSRTSLRKARRLIREAGAQAQPPQTG